MSSIPLPALALQPQQPQPGPLDQYRSLVALKSLLGNQQLQQQQIQGAKLENQQRQYQIGQTQAVNQAYRDALKINPDGTPTIDTNSLSQSLASGGHGEAISGILKTTADYQKSMADAAKAQTDVQTSYQDAMGSVGKAIQNSNYDPNLADLLLQHQLAMPGVPPQLQQRLQQVDQQIKQNPAIVKQIADQLVSVSQEQQKFQNALDVANVRAGTPEAKALQSALATGAIQNPSEWPAFEAKQKAQATATAQGTPDAVRAAATKAAAEEAARIQQENSPSAIAGAAAKAKAVQQAISGGALVPLENVPPHLVAPAAAAAQKAGEAYSQAQQAADDMQSMIDLAGRGNKVAYAYSPVTGVLQINVAGQTKRMNMNEIEQYAGAGSAMDRIQGFLGKQATGASIPPDVLKDMATVSQSYAQNASKKYQRDLDVTNSTYGSSFKVPDTLMAKTAQGFAVPKGAPSATGLSDGHKLKDSRGNVIAISQGGQWVNPQAQPTQ